MKRGPEDKDPRHLGRPQPEGEGCDPNAMSCVCCQPLSNRWVRMMGGELPAGFQKKSGSYQAEYSPSPSGGIGTQLDWKKLHSPWGRDRSWSADDCLPPALHAAATSNTFCLVPVLSSRRRAELIAPS